MSLAILAMGKLSADPVKHKKEETGSVFATARLATPTDGDSVLISVIAFSEAGEALLAHRKGDQIAVAGYAKPSQWTGKAGETKHGLSMVADHILSAYAVSKRRREVDLFEGAL